MTFKRCLATQVLDLVRRRGPGRIASQSLLPRLEKVFRPAVIKVLDDPLAAAELGDTVLAAQAFQYNATTISGPTSPAPSETSPETQAPKATLKERR
jgi:hypothetical protein